MKITAKRETITRVTFSTEERSFTQEKVFITAQCSGSASPAWVSAGTLQDIDGDFLVIRSYDSTFSIPLVKVLDIETSLEELEIYPSLKKEEKDYLRSEIPVYVPINRSYITSNEFWQAWPTENPSWSSDNKRTRFFIFGKQYNDIIKALNELDLETGVGEGDDHINGLISFEVLNASTELLLPLTEQLDAVGYAVERGKKHSSIAAKSGKRIRKLPVQNAIWRARRNW